jgi:hypothetical protein
MHAKALMLGLEDSSLTPTITAAMLLDHHRMPKPGETVSIYFDVAGPKLYVDAAWKTRSGQDAARPGRD